MNIKEYDRKWKKPTAVTGDSEARLIKILLDTVRKTNIWKKNQLCYKYTSLSESSQMFYTFAQHNDLVNKCSLMERQQF
jgi:hypothetical protein